MLLMILFGRLIIGGLLTTSCADGQQIRLAGKIINGEITAGDAVFCDMKDGHAVISKLGKRSLAGSRVRVKAAIS